MIKIQFLSDSNIGLKLKIKRLFKTSFKDCTGRLYFALKLKILVERYDKNDKHFVCSRGTQRI
jgi:hypothetical protein